MLYPIKLWWSILLYVTLLLKLGLKTHIFLRKYVFFTVFRYFWPCDSFYNKFDFRNYTKRVAIHCFIIKQIDRCHFMVKIWPKNTHFVLKIGFFRPADIGRGGGIFLEQLPYGFSGPQDIQFYENHFFFDMILHKKK